MLSLVELDEAALATANVTAAGIDTTLCTLTGLLCDTTYYLYVRNRCGADMVAPYVGTSFRSATAMPAVINLAATAISHSAIAIGWESDTARFADETAWAVICVKKDSAVTSADIRFSTEREYYFLGLDVSTAYDIYVSPVDMLTAVTGASSKLLVTTAAAPRTCLQVVEGTSSYTSSSSTRTVPVDGYNADAAQRNQMIYPASMLAGLEGKTLTGMQFSISTPSTLPSGWSTSGYTCSFNVKLAATTQEDLSSGWADTTGATLVFVGNMSDDGTVDFSNNFTYTGGNLLVEFELPARANWKGVGFYGQSYTAGGRTAYGSNNNVVNYLPNVKFCYIDIAPCSSVTSLAASDVTSNSAKLSWMPGAAESAWEYVVSATELDAEALASATATPVSGKPKVTLGSLDADIDYHAYVRAACSESTKSEWASVTFTTLATCSTPTGVTVDSVKTTSAYITVLAGQYAELQRPLLDSGRRHRHPLQPHRLHRHQRPGGSHHLPLRGDGRVRRRRPEPLDRHRQLRHRVRPRGRHYPPLLQRLRAQLLDARLRVVLAP